MKKSSVIMKLTQRYFKIKEGHKMRSNKVKAMSLLIATVVTFTGVLSGCASKKTVDVDATVVSTNKVKPASPTNNKDKVYNALGSWPKPPLYSGNNHGAGGVGSAYDWVYEGLLMPVRSTDTIYNWLADDYKDEGNKTTIKIKQGVKWFDGEPYTSKDVWAYYMLNWGTDITKYLSAIDTPDASTVVFTWQTPAPYSSFRKKLISNDVQGSIGYHQYSKYVDKAVELLKQCKKLTDPTISGAYGLDTEPLREQFDLNWNAFCKVISPSNKPIGTGPYKVETVTVTDLIMVKNEAYWNKAKINFDKLNFKMVPDASGQLALLKQGQLTWMDGTPGKDILDNLLASNKDIVHYRMLDPAAPGMMFNIRRKPFDDIKVRQAVAFVLDKSKIREVGNYYGKEYPEISAVAIVPSRLDKVLLPEVKAKMTNYSTNAQKAEALLKEAGWSKGSDKIWMDKDGKKASFIIASDQGASDRIRGSQVVADQLTNFGLPTKLKSVDGSIYWTNADKGDYDMSTDFVDINWGYTDDWHTLRDAFRGSPKSKVGFPTAKVKDAKGKMVDTGRLDMKFPGPDGKIIDVESTLDKIPVTADVKQRQKLINDLVYIYNENCWVVEWYQNVTGAFLNTKLIDGNFPMAGEITKYNRDMPIPTTPEDITAITELNLGFVGGRRILMSGSYWPK